MELEGQSMDHKPPQWQISNPTPNKAERYKPQSWIWIDLKTLAHGTHATSEMKFGDFPTSLTTFKVHKGKIAHR